jgi:hypothetical protein
MQKEKQCLISQKTFFSNASGGGTEVDHSPRLSKVKGLSLTSGTGERNSSFKKWIPMFIAQLY